MGEFNQDRYVDQEFDEIVRRLDPELGNLNVLDVTRGIASAESYANRRQNIVRRAGILTVRKEMPRFLS